MKVALYTPWLYTKGGAERVYLELFKRSRHEFSLFTHHLDPKTTFEEFSNYDVRPLSSGLKTNGIIAQGVNFAKEILNTKIKLDEFDVFVISAGIIGSLITIRNHDIPTMCYCQAGALFDEKAIASYKKERFNNYFSRTAFSLSNKVYHLFEKKAWSYMDLVVANSDYIKSLILKKGLAEQIFILNPGIDTAAFRPTWNYDKYFLVPGRIDKTKGQHLAIEAFKLFSNNNNGFKLVVAGQLTEKNIWYYNQLKELSQDNPNISIVTDCQDKDLTKLYQNAFAVMVPSMAESWGLVALEAMACGKPVLTKEGIGTSEIVIDGKTGFVLPADPAEFATRMEILVRDTELHKEMSVNAHQRALQYDWNELLPKFDNYIEITKGLRGVDRSKISTMVENMTASTKGTRT